MPIWNTKFDYKNGENRICNTCSKEYHTYKPLRNCKKCLAEKYKVTKKPTDLKAFYPYSTAGNGGVQRKHFTNIRKRLRKAWLGGREELTKHYDKVFEEIEANGILEWIYDRRDGESLNEGRVKRDTKIKKEYPNTKGFTGYEE